MFDRLQSTPEVSAFMKTVAPNQDPLTYFLKPLDPNTGEFDPYFHVTAKYCGGDGGNHCKEYYDKTHTALKQDFPTSLIGLFFTKDCYGVRVNLTAEQEDMFAMEETKNRETYAEDSNARTISSITLNSQGRIVKSNSYPGIQFIPQPINFQPSNSRAHITLGCAPGIPAVQTGFDLLQLIEYETNSEPHKDFEIKNIGVLRLFHPENVTRTTFVLYPEELLLVDGKFEAYEIVSKASLIRFDLVLVGTLVCILFY